MEVLAAEPVVEDFLGAVVSEDVMLVGEGVLELVIREEGLEVVGTDVLEITGSALSALN